MTQILKIYADRVYAGQNRSLEKTEIGLERAE
jgi:hypothetical protein